ncbi:MAG: GNAT family N-acetyltransferase [Allosphingosinicella sp.]
MPRPIRPGPAAPDAWSTAAARSRASTSASAASPSASAKTKAPLLVPILETERLRLRAYTAQDLDDHAETMRDPAVVRHLGGTAMSREESWRRICTATGLWPLIGYGYWAIERLSDRRWIGLAGFADFKRDVVPSIENIPEMGWIFAPHAHGQGYALEATRAAMAWADANLAGREFVAIIDPANAPSIRLAEKLGFGAREDATYRGEPILLFRRPPA